VALFAATLLIQTAGHGLFALNYFKYQAVDADRQAFLMRNVKGFGAVPWINANLKTSDRIYIQHRQLRFYLKIPSFFGSPLQAAIEQSADKTNARKLYRQMRSQGITHFYINTTNKTGAAKYPEPLNLLRNAGCMEVLKRFEGQTFSSRTLPTLLSIRSVQSVLRLKDEGCLR